MSFFFGIQVVFIVRELELVTCKYLRFLYVDYLGSLQIVACLPTD